MGEYLLNAEIYTLMHGVMKIIAAMDTNWLIEDMEQAVSTVNGGGVILYPTDTIWGIGCDATDPAAVERIRDIKGREEGKAFIVLAADIDMVKEYVKMIHPRVETLLNFHQRPLTIIYKSSGVLPETLLARGGTIGIRIPVDQFCQELIRAVGKPIVSTSANISGDPNPSGYSDISPAIIEKVDYVVKYRRDEKMDGKPSVVASFDRKGVLHFIRS